MKRIATLTFVALLALAGRVHAKNIDLVTLPNRDSVQLTIYNSEDITLVKETRYITLKRGANRLQFSWANTLIDPSSVEFRPLERAGDIEVAHTTFPGQKPQHLIWTIESKYEGQVKVEVSYFTSGLTWSMDYVAVTDPDETGMNFRGFVRVFNQSGESYEHAEVRLIVGSINLVEKIADLARRKGIPTPSAATADYQQLRLEAVAKSMGVAGRRARDQREGAKKVVKEGLSEYFMFSVAGTETLENGWSKRMPAVEASDMKFEILYRMRDFQYGPRPVRFFVWRNDADHHLGDAPLPNGLVRVFRKNGNDGLSYLGQQLLRYVPIKAEIEVNLGADDLVVYETHQGRTERLNIRFHNDNVIGWDERARWRDRIRNYRKKPIRFDLRRRWPGHVDYEAEHATTLFDFQTIETSFHVAPRGTATYACVVTRHLGKNASQNRIQLR